MAHLLRIVVTGAEGQLGYCLRQKQPESLQVIYAGHNTLDLQNHELVHGRLKELKPNFVINAAAYTKVDQAETEIDKAFAVNHYAVRSLAEACRERKIILLHISTDFLFHGSFNRPIDEEQIPSPLGVYAQSKYAGEQAMMQSGVTGAIIRTAWLYSEYGNNFMKTILRLANDKPQLRVIADQHGSPTYAIDLATALWRMILHAEKTFEKGISLWHFSNYGVTTWYDFAHSILEVAKIKTPIEPILTAEYPVKTPRPAYSALWPRKFSHKFDFPIRHWRDALREAVEAYIALQGGKP